MSMPKKDFSQVAFDVVQQATGAIPKRATTAKQDSSAKGGKKGGKTRMEAMTAEERRELALKAANARWATKTSTPEPDGTGVARKG